jgi:N-acetylated-alpha-linked acidic dipeptidase
MRFLCLFLIAAMVGAQDFERRARQIPDASRMARYFDRMGAEPHHAGSPGSKAVAEYARGLFAEFGLDVNIETFEALLPYPKGRLLEMTAPARYTAKLTEPAIAADPDSTDQSQLPTYNAYSAAGDVTAPLVYVNYGTLEDYEQLKKMGVDVKGKIVIARYGRSWRGVKPKLAAANGALACIIYSDPKEDGYFAGDVYPKGAYRPPAGVQRGSVMDMAIHPGDPLSPGFASETGSRRLPMADAQTLTTVPVMPISYEDAQPLLQNLAGQVAPESWRGALPITYHVGPGESMVHFKIDFDNATRPVHNVIATIPGSVWPDQWVIYGNHHDAWVNGAADPLSGAVALLETARTLAELRKQGWKPARTIKLCLWDAEEFGLIGSTEWVEKHADELRRKAVVYLNSDSTGNGIFSAGGSSPLEAFTTELLREFADPATGKTVLEASTRRRGGLTLAPLGSGSDYVAFAHHLGIASANYGFGSEMSGVYHSIYDSLAWYRKFGDPDLKYTKLFSAMMTTGLMRLSSAPLLPFRYDAFTRNIESYTRELSEFHGVKGNLDLQSIRTATSKLKQTTTELDALTAAPPAKANLAAVSEALYLAERALCPPEGLPGRPWYRNLITAPGQYTGYGAKTLPGIREAAEFAKWSEANQQARVLATALSAYDDRLREAIRLLRAE